MYDINVIKMERGIDDDTFIPYIDVTIRLNMELVVDVSRSQGEDSIHSLIGSEIMKALERSERKWMK